MIDHTQVRTPGVEILLRHPDDHTRVARVGHDPRRGGVYVEVDSDGNGACTPHEMGIDDE